MIPNMYKIAGEGLPSVFHVSARTVASHALNIFGDHSDVMACRQTGFAMLAENSVQEVMDLGAVAHLSAIKGGVPFINFFDGFRTSHEIQKVAVWDYEDLKEMCDMDAVQAFRDHALNPEHPHARGSHENGDIFFQHREACNPAYNALPAVVEEYMDKVNAKLGTSYHLFDYYGAPDADRVVVCMGSFCDVLEEVVDYLTAKGEKVGLLKVRLYRPWSLDHFIAALPETVKSIAVLDRTKEPGSLGEPLYQDVINSLFEAGKAGIKVIGGRYGLGSKDTPPASAFAVYAELAKDEPKREFTIGIVDDVTNLSLDEDKNAPITSAPGTIECKFWGLGGDGTVGANKNSIKIIGDHTDKYHHRVQVLGSRRRRYGRRQQELDQDHRRPHRQVRPGLLPVRLQEDRRRHRLAPALRRLPDPLAVLRQRGRLRGLPQPQLHHQGLQDGPGCQAGRHVHDQLPVVARGA